MMKLYKLPIKKINPPIHFESRDRTNKMSYRYYPCLSTHTIVLFHGLVSSSIYLTSLAHRIAERNIAQVIVPDMRGHGEDHRELSWAKPYSALQDFEEMMIQFKSRTAVEKLSMLGHSFGTRWMLKLLETENLKMESLYLVAPCIFDQQISPDWLRLNGTEYKVNWPDGLRTAQERVEYPVSYIDYFKIEKEKLNVVLNRNSVHTIEAGQDEILSPLGIESKTSLMIESASHMGLVIEPSSINLLCDVIEKNTLA